MASALALGASGALQTRFCGIQGDQEISGYFRESFRILWTFQEVSEGLESFRVLQGNTGVFQRVIKGFLDDFRNVSEGFRRIQSSKGFQTVFRGVAMRLRGFWAVSR